MFKVLVFLSYHDFWNYQEASDRPQTSYNVTVSWWKSRDQKLNPKELSVSVGLQSVTIPPWKTVVYDNSGIWATF